MSKVTINSTKMAEILTSKRTQQRASPEKLLRALEIVAQHIIDLDVLNTEELDAVSDIYPDWNVGVAYSVGKVLNFQGSLVKVIQAHTSQVDWPPDTTSSLYTVFHAPGTTPNWVQPTGAHDAFHVGEEVKHDNPNDSGNIWVYRSLINANTTEPGRDGTFDRWWEPVNLV